MSDLVQDQKMYDAVKELGQYIDVHAVYKPDGTDGIFGDCYCAALDMFAPGITFRIYFKMVDEQIKIEQAERWRFG